MLTIAVRMLLQNRSRFVVTVAGIGVAFFLSAAQVGLLVGWCNTTSALIRHAGADVWVMARQTPAYDYGTPIPRTRIYQVRSLDGVAWAEGLFVGWNYWHRPDGSRVNIEVVGLDESSAGGPWRMKAGDLEAVHGPHGVVVDELYLHALGVAEVGDEVEVLDNRAVLGGVCAEVRTFTAAPFVFTSLASAIRYDRRYRDDEITYVLVRCAPGVSPEEVRDAIARQVPAVEALTAHEFAVRTMKYWMLETGVGITVVVTALLGLAVGAVIISQTLFALTQDHLANYATLLALGFSRGQLVRVVLGQSLVLGLAGVGLGTVGFLVAARLSAPTQIPLETTGAVFAAVMGISLGCCLLASFVAVRAVFRIDPVLVFRG
jgi:putative ABC transport system permease protein